LAIPGMGRATGLGMLQLGPNLYTNFQAARLPQHCSDNSIECADMNLQRAYGPFLFNRPGNENVGGNQDGKKGWLLCVMYTTYIYILKIMPAVKRFSLNIAAMKSASP